MDKLLTLGFLLTFLFGCSGQPIDPVVDKSSSSSSGNSSANSASSATSTSSSSSSSSSSTSSSSSSGQWIPEPLKVLKDKEIIKGFTPLRRLNQQEIANSVGRIFGRGGAYFSGRALSNNGEIFDEFTTQADKLSTSREWTQKYLDVVIKASTKMLKENVVVIDCPDDDALCVVDSLTPKARLLFRRDLTVDESMQLARIYTNTLENTGVAEYATRACLIYLLISPNFLFLNTQIYEAPSYISSAELADRLSLALSASVGDQNLISLAENYDLHGPNLELEISRLLDGPDLKEFIHLFLQNWLIIEANLKRRYSSPYDYSELTRNESVMFVSYLIEQNRPLGEMITANYSFLNSKSAERYGLELMLPDFEKTNLPNHRQGILTQPQIIATANLDTKINYIQRGAYFQSILFCENYPSEIQEHALADLSTQVQALDTREQISIRTSDSRCAKCHKEIDQIGMAFNAWTNSGRDRNYSSAAKYSNAHPSPQDTHGVFNKKKFSNVKDFGRLLAKNAKFERCFTSKLLSYVTGREFAIARNKEHQILVDEILGSVRKRNGSIPLKTLIIESMSHRGVTATGIKSDQNTR